MTTLLLAAVLLLVALVSTAAAHPLGTLTVSTHTGLVVAPTTVAVDFVVDLAEVPTLQAREFADADGDGAVSSDERHGYAEQGCERWAQELDVAEDADPIHLRVADVRSATIPGESGLSTLRIECVLSGDRPTRAGADEADLLTVVDRTFPDRLGWREIVATGDGTEVVDSTVSPVSRSSVLTTYPEELLDDPPDVRRARLRVRDGGGSLPGQDAPATTRMLGTTGILASLEAVVATQVQATGLGVVALLAALALGGVHALAPGHGKALIGAYLVGQRGRLRDALALAGVVAATHTAGVVVLGAALWTAAVTAPERLYPWLGAGSGVVIAAVGVVMLRRARRSGHSHNRGPVHDHAHDDASDRGHRPATPDDHPTTVGLPTRTMVAMGFAGGVVPTPSAVLVVLSAMALGRLWVGIVLVLAYGLGMAAVLVGFGAALATGRDHLRRTGLLRASARLHRLSHALPSITAAVVVGAGALVVVRSLATL